jgi:hypothetical protein
MVENHMKQQVDQALSECQFPEGDHVFLRLQPYKKNSLKAKHCQNLAPKFYGPYTDLKHVVQVAYQLALTNHSKIHLVFHASCLKKVIGTKCQIQTNLLELDKEIVVLFWLFCCLYAISSILFLFCILFIFGILHSLRINIWCYPTTRILTISCVEYFAEWFGVFLLRLRVLTEFIFSYIFSIVACT